MPMTTTGPHYPLQARSEDSCSGHRWVPRDVSRDWMAAPPPRVQLSSWTATQRATLKLHLQWRVIGRSHMWDLVSNIPKPKSASSSGSPHLRSAAHRRRLHTDIRTQPWLYNATWLLRPWSWGYAQHNDALAMPTLAIRVVHRFMWVRGALHVV